MRSALRSSSTRSIRTAPTSIPGSRRAGRAAIIREPTGTSGPTPSRTARRPTTGSRYSADRPGPGTRGGGNITCTISCTSSPTSTCTIARCRTRCSTSRASGSTAGSTASGSTRSTSRCTTRSFATIRRSPEAVGKRTRPFDFQQHLYNQSHPDIPLFLERLRGVDRQLWRALHRGRGRRRACPTGDEAVHARRHDRLNSAYGFDFLYAEQLTPELVDAAMRLWPGGPGEGWPSWAFYNHDAPRAVSRWRPGATRDRLREAGDASAVRLRGTSSSSRARNSGCRRPTFRSSGCRIPRRSPTGRRP